MLSENSWSGPTVIWPWPEDSMVMKRLLLLLPLPAIALWVFYCGINYEEEAVSLTSRSSAGPPVAAPELSGLKRRGQPRIYSRDNLYEYVNGHAEFFISAGFEKLTVHEYASKTGAGELTLEIYDMGSPENALGTLSREKGLAALVQGIGRKAYSAPGLLLFYKGKYYVKAAGFHLEEETLRQAGTEAAATLEGGRGEGGDSILPAEGIVEGSRGFVKADYLALSFLDNVKTANYDLGGVQAEGFVFSAAPDRLLEFFRRDGAAVSKEKLAGLQAWFIESKYEGSLSLITDGRTTVGLKGEVGKTRARQFLEQAAMRMGE